MLAQAGARPAELRRREAVATLHIVLGAEVFQVDPPWRRRSRRHPRNEGSRQLAAEGFDDDIAGQQVRVHRMPFAPVTQLDGLRPPCGHPAQR